MEGKWLSAYAVHARYCPCGGANQRDVDEATRHNQQQRCDLCGTVGMCGDGWHRVDNPSATVTIEVSTEQYTPAPLRTWRRLHEIGDSRG